MTKSIHLFLTMLIGILCASSQVASAQDNQAMEVKAEQDWGTIRLPKEHFVEATIPIRNVASKGLLKILEIKPGCGCTKTDPDKTELEPGETSTVKIHLNLSPSQSGPMVKTVAIKGLHGNDTIMKFVLLKVNLERVLLITPSTFVSFNDATIDVESSAVVTFTNPSLSSITISKVAIDGMITANLPEGSILAPQATREVTIRVTPKEFGQIYGSVKFVVSGNGDDEEFVLPAYGVVNKAVSKP